VAAMNTAVALLAERHQLKVDVRAVMPEGAVAFAHWQTRTIVIPPIVDSVSFATALHEIGHVLQGACPDREPHRRDRSDHAWWCCVACEADAWRRALTLAPFSRRMFSDLQQSLRIYRRKTPASAEALHELDRIAGSRLWAEEYTKWRKWKDMIAKTERAMAESSRRQG